MPHIIVSLNEHGYYVSTWADAWGVLLLTVLSEETPEAYLSEPRTLRTLRGLTLHLQPACRFLDQEALACDEMGPNRLQKETKQENKDAGPSQQGIWCQQHWTGGPFSCWVSKVAKNTPISMTPFPATASELSLCFFPLLEQTMQPGPENNCSFPACVYCTGPSILWRAESSPLGAGGE